ncbi:Elongator complex protein 4 [Lactarius akahatsu]|uniref:Elongator complex protein 4 n=1 Tax=Lactarius akahatsu TaxID=416441 RepID=A0AAD4QCG9_9AGAM|nr:Elongator complex protein 4 [Lactarius akahatsu]
MSTFRRKTSSKPVDLLAGTRASSFSSYTVFTSSGIASLDDILGGGLPLSCSLLVIAPDTHSSYGELVQKYFISQGLVSGQKVYVVDEEPEQFVSKCMWPSNGAPSTAVRTVEDNDDNDETDHEPKVTIAWRYEHLKRFQTTVSTSQSSADDFCQAFDLTQRIPGPFLDQATKSSQLVLLNASRDSKGLIDVIAESLGASSQDVVPIRICIPLLGSPGWGDLQPKDVLYFAYSLRTLLRRYPHACASVSLPPNMSGDNWGGRGWLNKLSWLFDASVTLAGFSDPSLSLTFPSHHGSVRVHGLPTPHSLIPASDRSSTLRGISFVSGWTGGGENNLAFKCTRKRFVIETHHLDVEGGVGERRTTPAGIVGGDAEGIRREKKSERNELSVGVGTAGRAAMKVELEEEGRRDMEAAAAGVPERRRGRGKKVTFWGERAGRELGW